MFQIQKREDVWYVNGVGPFDLMGMHQLAGFMRTAKMREVLHRLSPCQAPAWDSWAALLDVAVQQSLGVEDRWTKTTEDWNDDDVVTLNPAIGIPGGEDTDPDAEVIHPKKVTKGRHAHVRRFLAELKARNYTRKEAISPMIKLNLRDCEPPLTTGELQGPLDATWPHAEQGCETKRGC